MRVTGWKRLCTEICWSRFWLINAIDGAAQLMALAWKQRLIAKAEASRSVGLK
jgi:hypothetical protein